MELMRARPWILSSVFSSGIPQKESVTEYVRFREVTYGIFLENFGVRFNRLQVCLRTERSAFMWIIEKQAAIERPSLFYLAKVSNVR
jgi:hypothetical protein